MREPVRSAKPFALALVAMNLAASANADIYAGRDAIGVPVFSDRPGDGLAFYLGTDDLPAGVPARRQPPASFRAGMVRHDHQIRRAAIESDLEPALLHAVVQVESGYNPLAVSSKGAIGLMQLMPATAKELGVGNIRDPVSNLRGGARHLRALLKIFDGSLPLALAAYNAGEGSVRRYSMRIPPFPETRVYVEAVLRRYQLLQEHGRH